MPWCALESAVIHPFRRTVLFACAALLALAGAHPLHAADGVVVEPLLQPRRGLPVRLALEGLPALACPHRLESASADAAGITLRLASAAGCGPPAPAGRLLVEPQGLRWGPGRVARVRIEDGLGPGGAPRLLGFSLLPLGTAARTTTPEAGYWWNEAGGEFDLAGPGVGLNLERQGDTLGVTVLGYAEDGRPEWLFGAGPIQGQVARVPLSRLQDGAGPFRPWQPPGQAEPAGVVHFDFLSEARAVAWFERRQGQGITLQPMSLVRFRFDDRHAQSSLGEWLFVGGIAQGDASSQTASLHFDRIEVRPDGFRLAGASQAPTLDCSLDPERPNSPPARCVLRDAGGALLVDFTDTALGRMRGWRPDGASVTALHQPAD